MSAAPPLKVKVCGLRRYEDAKVALDAGAWALGFVFHRPSKRFIEPAEAARIVARLPEGTLTVGVFVDSTLAALNEVVRQVRLAGVQLHGQEDPAYAEQVESAMVIKAFRVGPDFDDSVVDAFAGCRILLDTYHERLPGGTGRTFDWRVARRLGERTPVLLAGGLTPDNVVEALRAARPAGVDVSGGVEAAPGVKDAVKLRRFLDAAAAFGGD